MWADVCEWLFCPAHGAIAQLAVVGPCLLAVGWRVRAWVARRLQ